MWRLLSVKISFFIMSFTSSGTFPVCLVISVVYALQVKLSANSGSCIIDNILDLSVKGHCRFSSFINLSSQTNRTHSTICGNLPGVNNYIFWVVYFDFKKL